MRAILQSEFRIKLSSSVGPYFVVRAQYIMYIDALVVKQGILDMNIRSLSFHYPRSNGLS